ncbi:hypothetical protein J1605_019928 [Eschrichtius robustus]|uniref:Uncharacterized protein n=1 Tax=Eschrichtius robustus TaxID=9764 RepID=A0AB34HLD4_ESCRO|nr:hypothetical protein J1605_019928 [Eschrichtius robustus]
MYTNHSYDTNGLLLLFFIKENKLNTLKDRYSTEFYTNQRNFQPFHRRNSTRRLHSLVHPVCVHILEMPGDLQVSPPELKRPRLSEHREGPQGLDP